MSLVSFARIAAWCSLALNSLGLSAGLLGLALGTPVFSEAQLWRFAFFVTAALLTLEWIKKDYADVR